MKKYPLLLASAILMLMITTSAFSQDKPESFSYRYPAKDVSYRTKAAIHEVLDVQGQSMDVYVNNAFRCRIKSDGNKINVTMDSLSQMIDSPQGTMGGQVDIKDKSFNLGIASSGKVTDLSAAKQVTYTVPGSSDGNISTSFIDFFPVLPEGQIRPGYTWTTSDTVRSDAADVTQTNVITANNKFEGYEDVNGMRCAKFTSATQGTSTMRNQVQGMDMKTSGDFTGNTVTWFAPSKGYFVKYTENTKMTGQMEMPNEGYNFPIKMDIIRLIEAVE